MVLYKIIQKIYKIFIKSYFMEDSFDPIYQESIRQINFTLNITERLETKLGLVIGLASTLIFGILFVTTLPNQLSGDIFLLFGILALLFSCISGIIGYFGLNSDNGGDIGDFVDFYYDKENKNVNMKVRISKHLYESEINNRKILEFKFTCFKISLVFLVLGITFLIIGYFL